MTATAALAVLDAGDVLANVRHLEALYPPDVVATFTPDDRRRVAAAIHLASHVLAVLDRRIASHR